MPPKAPEYLRKLPSERQAMMRALRDHIRRNLPVGYVERFEGRAFTYEVPLKTYSNTYNGRPLVLAAIASQTQLRDSVHDGCVRGQGAREMVPRSLRGERQETADGQSRACTFESWMTLHSMSSARRSRRSR